MFNNKAQSYKFYWFEAVLNLTKDTDEDLTFEEITDEMKLGNSMIYVETGT
ncbi:hypothetical protein C823_004034 [Eubacterium plexicaudatum ASF492]|uniref:Uncharacterized protein n=1 Tax=Eubacterium plexicaudatum ASF492 TaxID=1235802 RepID=N2A6B1_9FIRM|nr:hypothetical protein C823_004034 [Eubacterium plexicaudatum ASF492]